MDAAGRGGLPRGAGPASRLHPRQALAADFDKAVSSTKLCGGARLHKVREFYLEVWDGRAPAGNLGVGSVKGQGQHRSLMLGNPTRERAHQVVQ